MLLKWVLSKYPCHNEWKLVSHKDGIVLITNKAPLNIKGFVKFSNDREPEIILRTYLLLLHKLVKIEPEETLWSAYSNTWRQSESFAPSRSGYVHECKSPFHELDVGLFSPITIPKTQHLQNVHNTCVYIFDLCGSIYKTKTTNYRRKMKWRRFGFCSMRLHISHLNTPRSDSQIDQIQWFFFFLMEPFLFPKLGLWLCFKFT